MLAITAGNYCSHQLIPSTLGRWHSIGQKQAPTVWFSLSKWSVKLVWWPAGYLEAGIINLNLCSYVHASRWSTPCNQKVVLKLKDTLYKGCRVKWFLMRKYNQLWLYTYPNGYIGLGGQTYTMTAYARTSNLSHMAEKMQSNKLWNSTRSGNLVTNSERVGEWCQVSSSTGYTNHFAPRFISIYVQSYHSICLSLPHTLIHHIHYSWQSATRTWIM